MADVTHLVPLQEVNPANLCTICAWLKSTNPEPLLTVWVIFIQISRSELRKEAMFGKLVRHGRSRSLKLVPIDSQYAIS